jgi:predicted dehydrogenase
MTTDNIRHDSPLRGALIGFGNVAEHAHLPLFQKSAHFIIDAVVEPSKERAGRAERLLPEAMICSDIDHVLTEGKMDFVDICTPPCFHAELALKALRAGFHVFCEKPLATSFNSVSRLIDAAVEHRRALFTVNNWKYAPIWIKVIELTHQGMIGRVQSISLNVLRTPNSGGGLSDWRKIVEIAGGGIILDHGWHHLYLVLSIMKAAPDSISARIKYSDGSKLDDEADLVVRFKDAEAHLHFTWRSTERKNFGVIEGEKGSIKINDDHLILHTRGLAPIRYDFSEALSGGSHHTEWMKAVIENFRWEVADETVRGANLTEAKQCARLISLCYQSHQAGSCFLPVDE